MARRRDEAKLFVGPDKEQREASRDGWRTKKMMKLRFGSDDDFMCGYAFLRQALR